MPKTLTPKIRKEVFKKYNAKCFVCGLKENLNIHHIDTNKKNNYLTNLLLVCKLCHLKVHGKSYPKPHEQEILKRYRAGAFSSDIARELGLNHGGVKCIIQTAKNNDPTLVKDFHNNYKYV